MMEKQLLLFNENSEPILPELILSNLTPEEKDELIKMQEAYKKFCNMDSDQKTEYTLWENNFANNWGNFDMFINKLQLLKNNKKTQNKFFSQNKLKTTILEHKNINKLRILKFLWHIFWEKNQYSSYNTNGIQNIEDAFNKFKKRKSMQRNRKSYKINELFKELGITSFEKYIELIKDPKIIITLEKAKIIHKISTITNY